MWLNPESMRRWLCPGDTHVAYIELNPVVGGSFRIDMRAADGQVLIHTGNYLAIAGCGRAAVARHD